MSAAAIQQTNGLLHARIKRIEKDDAIHRNADRPHRQRAVFVAAIFHRDVTVRLRPGFFPFVEPGFELDIRCLICGGPGCPVCKQSGWVELLPCGLVNPNVLRLSGIDPEQWNGFAFGLGLTRLVMMRYAIDDIRQLQGGDLRFLQQF